MLPIAIAMWGHVNAASDGNFVSSFDAVLTFGRGRQALATVARSRIMFVGYHDAYIDACVLQACPRSFLRWIAVHL
jgi:hypothetical protein